MVTNQDIKRRCKAFFYKHFDDGQGSSCNREGLETQEDKKNLAYHLRIQIGVVKQVLKRMDNGEMIGLDGIPIEVCKCVGIWS